MTADQHHLAVIGLRQAGKSYLLQLYAVTEAFHGLKVLYENVNQDYAKHVMHECWDIAQKLRLPLEVPCVTDLSLQFHDGGKMWFSPKKRVYNIVPDLHILDNVGDGFEGHFEAKRVIRSVTM